MLLYSLTLLLINKQIEIAISFNIRPTTNYIRIIILRE